MTDTLGRRDTPPQEKEHEYFTRVDGVPRSEHGDLPQPPTEMIRPYYEQDGITIYHADSREVLPMLPTR